MFGNPCKILALFLDILQHILTKTPEKLLYTSFLLEITEDLTVD